MKYSIQPRIFDQYPTFARAVILAEGLSNNGTNNEDLYGLLHSEIRKVETDSNIELTHHRVTAWADVYDTFKRPDAKRTLPSVGALIKRIRNGGGSKIPFISPLVCISNTIALKHLTPSGLVDVDRLYGDVELGYASGGEIFRPIGSDTANAVEPDEIIYFDVNKRVVLCRSWNSRGGRDTLILPTTTRILFDIDALTHVLPYAELEAASKEVACQIRLHCGGTSTSAILSADHFSHEFHAANKLGE